MNPVAAAPPPEESGSMTELFPRLSMPSWSTLMPGWGLRLVCGVLLVLGAGVVLIGMVADKGDAEHLVAQGRPAAAVVVRYWTTFDGRLNNPHASVRLDGRVVELAMFDGTPRVGQSVDVLVDPRSGEVWLASTARRDARLPAWEVVLASVLALLALALTCWLGLWPVRLRRRARTARDLRLVRGRVLEAEQLPSRWLGASSWAVQLHNAAGGLWTAVLSEPPWRNDLDGLNALRGQEAVLLLIGTRFTPSSSAVLAAAAPRGSGHHAWWCARFPSVVPSAPGSGLELANGKGA